VFSDGKKGHLMNGKGILPNLNTEESITGYTSLKDRLYVVDHCEMAPEVVACIYAKHSRIINQQIWGCGASGDTVNINRCGTSRDKYR
jgi:hypothetical protein